MQAIEYLFLFGELFIGFGIQCGCLIAHLFNHIAKAYTVTQHPSVGSPLFYGVFFTAVLIMIAIDMLSLRKQGAHKVKAKEALIWSVQPELTRANTGQLARLLPKLPPKLREGLASIDYPADRTEAVFELLMQLHQQAFTPGPRVAAPATAAPAAAAPMATPAAEPAQPAPLDDDDPWVAPSEARESGYIDISQSPDSEGADTAPEAPPSNAAPLPLPLPASTITVGTWVNLQVAGQWERTQLSWIGSHGNLFLFTSASGRTQSMTLRLLDRLLQQGALQVLAEQTVVDNALNAVAQTAMQNSVESRH